MIDALLFRDYLGEDCTMGYLIIEDQAFHTLEPPWRHNQRNVSSIPPGTYRSIFLPRSASGKYRRVFHLQDVPGRSGILIHNGNTVDHTLGCIILGKRQGRLRNQRAVLNSRTAMAELNEIVDGQPLNLTIKEAR